MEAPTASEAAAVKTTPTAPASMPTTLGNGGRRRTNQAEGSKPCKKSVQQGGSHFGTLHLMAVGCPGGQTAYVDLTLLESYFGARVVSAGRKKRHHSEPVGLRLLLIGKPGVAEGTTRCWTLYAGFPFHETNRLPSRM
jgi:hypothetical protein